MMKLINAPFASVGGKTYCARQMIAICRSISFFKRRSDKEIAETNPDEFLEPSKFEYEESPPPPLPKSYTPPQDVEASIVTIAQNFVTEEVEASTQMTDNLVKFQVLSACIKHFQFDIPNYQLSELTTIGDVVNYFSQAHNPMTPEEKLKRADLPGNVSLHLEPIRFTEKTKDLFGGKTAYPQRDTIISSLKYRNIYEGYKSEKVYQRKDGFRYF